MRREHSSLYHDHASIAKGIGRDCHSGLRSCCSAGSYREARLGQWGLHFLLVRALLGRLHRLGSRYHRRRLKLQSGRAFGPERLQGSHRARERGVLWRDTQSREHLLAKLLGWFRSDIDLLYLWQSARGVLLESDLDQFGIAVELYGRPADLYGDPGCQRIDLRCDIQDFCRAAVSRGILDH